MSRLLDMLRRQWRSDGPTAPHHRRSIARTTAESGTPANRALVLDALSGNPRVAPWYRRRAVAALALLGACLLVLYLTVDRGHVSGESSGPPPRTAPAADSGVRSSSADPASLRADAPPRDTAPVPSVRVTLTPTVQQGVFGTSARRAGASARPTATSSVVPAGEAQPAPAAAPPASGGASAGEDRFARALRLQQAGDVENAIAEYRALLQANESNAQAHNNLGLLYQGQGLLDEAAGEFRRAIAIDPAYDRARNNLGVALMRAGDVAAAAGEFRRILAADARNQEAMINLALSARAGGHPDQARETLIRAIEINERSAPAHYNLALLYEDAREIARALEHYEAYLKYAAGTDATQVAAVREHCQMLRERLIRFWP